MFLQIGQIEESLSTWQKQWLARRVKPFIMKNEVLYIMGQDNRLSWCLSTMKAQKVMKELHEGTVGRHFATEITQKKILNVGYWWPTMYRYVSDFGRSCDACQHTGGLATYSLAKLIITFKNEPFMKWGLDFVGPIRPTR